MRRLGPAGRLGGDGGLGCPRHLVIRTLRSSLSVCNINPDFDVCEGDCCYIGQHFRKEASSNDQIPEHKPPTSETAVPWAD